MVYIINMILSTIWGMGLTIGVTVVLILSMVLIINALFSSKGLQGELGKAIKKIAAGVIFYVLLILTIFALNFEYPLNLTQTELRVYMIFLNTSGSLLLIHGFIKIHKIRKDIKSPLTSPLEKYYK